MQFMKVGGCNVSFYFKFRELNIRYFMPFLNSRI